MKKLLLAVLCALIPVALFWLSGFDFDKRGADAVFCALLSLILFVGVFFYPGWEKP